MTAIDAHSRGTTVVHTGHADLRVLRDWKFMQRRA
jgi:hypothetical protein